MPKFLKSILVELPLTATANGTTLNFNDVPQLRGKFVQGVESYTNFDVAKSFTQRDVLPQARVSNILVNLVTESETVFENLPYFTLNTYYNGGLIREFNNLKININKSNIYIASSVGLLTTQSLLFTFYYTDRPQ